MQCEPIIRLLRQDSARSSPAFLREIHMLSTARVAPEKAASPARSAVEFFSRGFPEKRMATYWEKLRDPRWQRRRLEIMQVTDFACYQCGTKDQTLNVHHKLYRKGASPWEYADHELVCLCEPCHEKEHSLRERLDQILAQGADLEQVLGYALGLLLWNQEDDSPPIEVPSWGIAFGIAAAFGLDDEDVIRNVGEGDNDYVISKSRLLALRSLKVADLRKARLIGKEYRDK